MSKRIEKDRRSVKRLRPEEIEAMIINTAFEELLEHGFRAVTVESISAKTGIAKTSIYRRWPNKAAMVMVECPIFCTGWSVSVAQRVL